MIALSINKKIDYSAPIMFIAYQTPIEQKKTVVAVGFQPKPQTITAQKTASIKNATTMTTPKPVIQAVKTEPTKIALVEKIEPKPDVKPKLKKIVEQKPIVDSSLHKAPQSLPNTTKSVEKPVPMPIIAPTIPDNAIVSNNYREVEALRCSAQLQKELANTWKPPVGVSSDCICEITFYVTQTGTLQNLNITKRSGVMIYDISARNALYAMKMPRWTYDKPFTITFKQ